MDRRESLRLMTLITGGALFTGLSSAILQGCSPTPENEATALTKSQFAELEAISETIIPTTDTPGAKEAQVAGFIESALKNAFSPEERSAFLKELNTFLSEVKVNTSSTYAELAADQQAQQLRLLAESGQPFWRKLKTIVLVGYFTSEIGATQALEYIPVPGPYVGCVPLKEGQKAWISFT